MTFRKVNICSDEVQVDAACMVRIIGYSLFHT
jgi:hypothetical protein